MSSPPTRTSSISYIDTKDDDEFHHVDLEIDTPMELNKSETATTGINLTRTIASSNSSTSTTSRNEDEAPPVENDTKRNTKWYCSSKLYVGLLLLGFVIFIIIDSTTNKYVRNGLEIFLEWIEDNPISGFFLFVIVYILATTLFIPGSLLTLGAGFVFSMSFGLGPGIVIGTISVFFGASIGAIIAFLLGRYLLLDQVRALSKKYAFFEALNSAMKTNGLKILSLLRLSPIIPFSALNYIAGALSVTIRDYVLSLFAILPGTVLYVFLGASAGSLADSSSSGTSPTVTIIIVVVGILLGVLAIWLTTRYARMELNRVIEERRAAEINTTATLDGDNAETPVSMPNDTSPGNTVNDLEAPDETNVYDVDGED